MTRLIDEDREHVLAQIRNPENRNKVGWVPALVISRSARRVTVRVIIGMKEKSALIVTGEKEYVLSRAIERTPQQIRPITDMPRVVKPEVNLVLPGEATADSSRASRSAG